MAMRVKICGITRADQGVAIARRGLLTPGVEGMTLGLIAVEASPRYVDAVQMARVAEALEEAGLEVRRVGVFVNASVTELVRTVRQGRLTGVQLHGEEPLTLCAAVREALPGVELVRAVRVRSPQDLEGAIAYASVVDTLLLDAYHPQLLGGTGHTLDWTMLKTFRPDCPWLLAGGLNPENVAAAITVAHPDGVDVSSGVENAPGDKDLERVQQLLAAIATPR